MIHIPNINPQQYMSGKYAFVTKPEMTIYTVYRKKMMAAKIMEM